jgi:AcrR family transcriptional regulator
VCLAGRPAYGAYDYGVADPIEKVPWVNPRVKRTKAHVLQVARELLLEVGPIDLTYTAVSARAGVTRQTLYRHWPTRERLLAELVLTGPDVAYPDPGSDARTVVTEFLTSLRAGMNDPPTAAALMGLAAQADRDPDSATALAAIAEDRRAALNTLLRPTGTKVTKDEFAQLCGPVIYSQLIARRKVSTRLIRDAADAWIIRQP